MTVALWAQAHYRRRTIDATLKNGRRRHLWSCPRPWQLKIGSRPSSRTSSLQLKKASRCPALANWPSVVEDALSRAPVARVRRRGRVRSRPTTPTQNRLKLKRSTTEDAVADERLWPRPRPRRRPRDAEAGMGGGRPAGGGGRALDRWRRPGLSKGSWPARTRRLVDRAREAATRRLQAGVLVERVHTKRRQALATHTGGRARVEAAARPRAARAAEI